MSDNDFAHHKPDFARLNHGSFGSAPAPVLAAQDSKRREYLSQPDEMYFSGRLDRELAAAAASVIPHLSSQGDTSGIDAEQICLVENATVATVAIARRWARMVEPGDVIVVLSVAYLACVSILREHCETAGATVEIVPVAFPAQSSSEIAHAFSAQLKQLAARGKSVKFAFLDHISSQPAILLPVADMVAACRQYGASEVAIDGAHSVGSTVVDVEATGADWFFSNLHKWGFAPSTATIVHAANTGLMRNTGHPITSWHWQKGLATESRFTGTRDYSAMLAVPTAMQYLHNWRSADGETSAQYCHRQVIAAAQQLSDAWGTAFVTPDEQIATQAMVKLPKDLRVDDVPGQPGAGIRPLLRDEYGVEAAIGNFGGETGSYVRLSFAIYNTADDIERLQNGVLDILQKQKAQG